MKLNVFRFIIIIIFFFIQFMNLKENRFNRKKKYFKRRLKRNLPVIPTGPSPSTLPGIPQGNSNTKNNSSPSQVVNVSNINLNNLQNNSNYLKNKSNLYNGIPNRVYKFNISGYPYSCKGKECQKYIDKYPILERILNLK